jgi:hypothetical protein
MHQVDGEDLSCELKVSASMDNARIVVVRDVTERYRRFEAERRIYRWLGSRMPKRLIALRDTK